MAEIHLPNDWPRIKAELERPFPVDKIHWRVGATTSDKKKGIALAYIDARHVMRRLDDVMGPCWQNKYTLSDGRLLICEITLLINGIWLTRSNGAGDTDVEAEKGKASDAFKRAAVQWGIARYLYSLPNEWVKIEPAGKSYKLAEIPNLPKWATPEGYDEIMEGRKK